MKILELPVKFLRKTIYLKNRFDHYVQTIINPFYDENHTKVESLISSLKCLCLYVTLLIVLSLILKI